MAGVPRRVLRRDQRRGERSRGRWSDGRPSVGGWSDTVARGGWSGSSRAIGVANGHAGVEIAGLQLAFTAGVGIAKLRSKSEYHTTWGAAVLAARCLSWDRKYQCIAGDDTARLAPGGTTPHSNTFFAWPVPRVL